MKRIGEYIFDGVGLLILILIWIGAQKRCFGGVYKA